LVWKKNELSPLARKNIAAWCGKKKKRKKKKKKNTEGNWEGKKFSEESRPTRVRKNKVSLQERENPLKASP